MSEAATNPEDLKTDAPENAAPEMEQPGTAQPRRRGRPPKTPGEAGPKKESVGAAPRARKSQKATESVTAAHLIGIHQMAFMFTGQKFPEINISEQEAQIMASSINAVCAQYDLNIDGKTGAFLQLAGAAAMIYAPRIMAIRKRIQDEKPIDVQSSVVSG